MHRRTVKFVIILQYQPLVIQNS